MTLEFVLLLVVSVQWRPIHTFLLLMNHIAESVQDVCVLCPSTLSPASHTSLASCFFDCTYHPNQTHTRGNHDYAPHVQRKKRHPFQDTQRVFCARPSASSNRLSQTQPGVLGGLGGFTRGRVRLGGYLCSSVIRKEKNCLVFFPKAPAG